LPMIDFLMIATRMGKRNTIEIYPKFIIKKSKDLMIRGSDFYAIWLEERGLWSTEEQDALQLIDRELDIYVQEHKQLLNDSYRVLHMWDAESGMIDNWHRYCQRQMRDNYHTLDDTLIFANTPVKKDSYASKRLPYPLEKGSISAYDELVGTLYSPEERQKIEWAIGAIVNGDSKKIQKFLVLYGPPGSGKSTVLNIVEKLFEGYCGTFDSKALGSSSNAFALEAFKSNPLIAIQHDGDLSHIEDNTRLNSLVSHETMMVNEKFRSAYANQFKCFLFLGTNKPVKITDAKSGLIRRLIDVNPSGEKIPAKKYLDLVGKVDFELGGIACHCKEVYEKNKRLYDDYIPTRMMGASNDFYNFMLDSYYIFKKENGVSLKRAWAMYNEYNTAANVPYPYSRRAFREELMNYFEDYKERETDVNGERVRSYYSGFKADKFKEFADTPQGESAKNDPPPSSWIDFKEQHSLFNDICKDCLAQYANENGTPLQKWENVRTRLGVLDTSRLHYVKVPENHIVIDFDIPGPDGKKSFERNLEAASKWPRTYAELSKSGAGIHLHYIYTGDAAKLSRIYDENIEVKVFTGKASLRRKLSKCNDISIANISSGLPLKGEKMVDTKQIQDERHLRVLIKKALAKEISPYTKPSVDFIAHIVEEAYEGNVPYDIDDMRNVILAFAANSTNQADACLKIVSKMHFKSKDDIERNAPTGEEKPMIFFDCEVFPNLLLVNWKFAKQDKVYRMINPSPAEIEGLTKYRLVGFNNRKYDNHILWARMLGMSNEQIYALSNQIINQHTGFFGEAYNLSYTDIYDFSSKKQSLKKFEIELGIHHQELGLPWDQPVPKSLWDKVAEYCDNDVLATEALFYSKDRQADFIAREILADLAGMTVNDTTNSLTARIIFGREKHPKLVYTDLATGKSDSVVEVEPDILTDQNIINAFPGYEWVRGDDGKMHNMFRGTDLGMGGYVYAEPGMYHNIALLDVASMHPHSAVAMNYFGEYTKQFSDLMDVRIHVKHGEYDKAKKLFGGKLAKYLDDPGQAKALTQALKIAINMVYGMTSATFDNPFRNPKNVNNIVALRGALFMRTLQDEVQQRGFTVAHIKTDSIKIPDATPEIIDFCMNFAKKYGYTFEHEATYEKMCLVNNAVYIAKYLDADTAKAQYGYIPEKNEKKGGKWTATGTQFQVPYVFKTLFSKEPIEFPDLCETKTVSKGAIYLDKNEDLPEGEHNYIFVGRVGQFCPIIPGKGGALLLREAGLSDTGERKYASVTGAKDYRWLESEAVYSLHMEDDIDKAYFDKEVNEAVDEISKYGDFEWFAADDSGTPPWNDIQDEAARNFEVR
jgi:energy-coupling factor transporter ATP-binding protein EcfA2